LPASLHHTILGQIPLACTNFEKVWMKLDGHKQIGVQDIFSFSADLIGVRKIGHQ